MTYVALKPCCFAGHRFLIGENVPGDLVHPGAAKNLVKMGVIAEQTDTANAITTAEPAKLDTITVIIRAKEGDIPLDLTADGLQAFVDVITGPTSEAEPVIAQMTDGDALILLHMADSRKAVKAAAEARAKALNTEESAGEQ